MNWYSTLYISNHFETNGPVRGVTWVGWPAAASLTSCECADDRNFKIVVILRVELAMLQKYIQYGGNEPRVTNLYVLQTSVLIIWTHLWQFFTKLDRRALTIEILSFDWIFFIEMPGDGGRIVTPGFFCTHSSFILFSFRWPRQQLWLLKNNVKNFKLQKVQNQTGKISV